MRKENKNRWAKKKAAYWPPLGLVRIVKYQQEYITSLCFIRVRVYSYFYIYNLIVGMCLYPFVK